VTTFAFSCTRSFLYDPNTPGSRWICIVAYNYEIEVHLNFIVSVLKLENQKLYSAPGQSPKLRLIKFFFIINDDGDLYMFQSGRTEIGKLVSPL
jgi:hypothetical protein